MLKALTDEGAIQSCQNNIQESSKRLGYLVNEMIKLQLERQQLTQLPVEEELYEAANQLQLSRNPSPVPSRKSTAKAATRKPSKINGLLKAFALSKRSNSESALSSSGSSIPDLGVGFPADNLFGNQPWWLTSLSGYIRSDTSITRDKVQYLIEEMQRKLEIEDRVREGTQRMIEATEMHSHAEAKKTKLDLDRKMAECVAKIFILQKALVQYQGLDLPKAGNSGSLVALMPAVPKFAISKREALSAKFTINVNAITALPGKKSSKTELFVLIRVDNTPKAVSRSSKSSWDEDLILYLEKAHEIEIAVHEHDGGVLGVVWFQLSDFIDELNKLEDNADAASPEYPRSMNVWLDLVPGGKIHVTFTIAFEKTKKKRDQTLTRQKAVQKFTIKQGHKFSAIKSYQVLKCAVCRDFLMSGQGLNCQMCDFTCHRKCEEKVVPKCISLLSTELTKDDILINHKIPHRFVESSTMGVHWCAHCGKMVPLGKGSHCRCSECFLVAHEHCADRIPDFCGLPDGLLQHVRESKTPSKTLDSSGSNHSLDLIGSGERASSKPNLYGSPYQNQSVAAASASSAATTSNFSQKSETSVKADSSPLSRPTTDKRKARGESLAYFRHGTKGVGLDDFTFLAVLGKGNFGKVMLAQEKFTNNYYGIKVLKKEFILEHDEVDR
ncbi:Serine/threonine kinase [Kappamyces sp. JEL0680]|nr:Serine/threonine kinase [Kappamyces sp. JEL0680]